MLRSRWTCSTPWLPSTTDMPHGRSPRRSTGRPSPPACPATGSGTWWPSGRSAGPAPMRRDCARSTTGRMPRRRRPPASSTTTGARRWHDGSMPVVLPLADSRADARTAAGRPAHREAVALIDEMYERTRSSSCACPERATLRSFGSSHTRPRPATDRRQPAAQRPARAARRDGSWRPADGRQLAAPARSDRPRSRPGDDHRPASPGSSAAGSRPRSPRSRSRSCSGSSSAGCRQRAIRGWPGSGVRGAAGPPVGIVLLGARLSVEQIARIGIRPSTIVAVVTMAAALTLVLVLVAIGRRRAPARPSCWPSARRSAATRRSWPRRPVIGARSRDVAYAVATVTLFGTIAVFVYPIVGHALGLGDAVLRPVGRDRDQRHEPGRRRQRRLLAGRARGRDRGQAHPQRADGAAPGRDRLDVGPPGGSAGDTSGRPAQGRPDVRPRVRGDDGPAQRRHHRSGARRDPRDSASGSASSIGLAAVGLSIHVADLRDVGPDALAVGLGAAIVDRRSGPSSRSSLGSAAARDLISSARPTRAGSRVRLAVVSAAVDEAAAPRRPRAADQPSRRKAIAPPAEVRTRISAWTMRPSANA